MDIPTYGPTDRQANIELQIDRQPDKWITAQSVFLKVSFVLIEPRSRDISLLRFVVLVIFSWGTRNVSPNRFLRDRSIVFLSNR